MYSSKTLQTYMQSFFQNVGGSGWANIQTQYCAYALAGSLNCAGGGGFVTNPKGQLKGAWTDPSAVPDDIVTLGLAQNLVDDPIASEAVRAVQHFGYNRDATYIILTPPESIGTGEGAAYCAYHTQTTSVDGLGNPERIQYAYIPWLNENWPGSGTTGCGMHNVNATSDAFGNGIFDGWSIATGHEYAEAVTDPDNFTSIQDGWNDDADVGERRQVRVDRTPRTSLSAATSSPCSRSGATRPTTPPVTAASSAAPNSAHSKRGGALPESRFPLSV